MSTDATMHRHVSCFNSISHIWQIESSKNVIQLRIAKTRTEKVTCLNPSAIRFVNSTEGKLQCSTNVPPSWWRRASVWRIAINTHPAGHKTELQIYFCTFCYLVFCDVRPCSLKHRANFANLKFTAILWNWTMKLKHVNKMYHNGKKNVLIPWILAIWI